MILLWSQASLGMSGQGMWFLDDLQGFDLLVGLWHQQWPTTREEGKLYLTRSSASHVDSFEVVSLQS